MRSMLAARRLRTCVRPHQRLLCSNAAPVADAAAKPPPDTRPWFIRNWGTSLFLSFVSTWGYTLWVSNKARKASDAVEEGVKERMPANADELLELRALNDAPAAAIASLPARAAATGRREMASRPELLALLRGAIASTPQPAADAPPLKEEYVLERMLMALSDGDDGADASSSSGAHAPSAGATAGTTTNVRMATGVLAFLSAGTVRERIETMYEALAAPAPPAPDGAADASRGVPVALLAPLLRNLMATGQVPPEKFVYVEDEGRYPVVNVQRSWFRVPPTREFTPDEWAVSLLHEHGALMPADDDAAALIDLERFVAMMQSDRVCLWGECYQIAERRRLAKLKAEADELVANPPFYRRAWNFVSGGGGKSATAAPTAD